MRASRDRVFSLSLLSYVYTWSCALSQLQGDSTQATPLCSSSTGSVLVCSWSRDDFRDPDTVVAISAVSLWKYGHEKFTDFSWNCSTNASSSTASCTIWGYRDSQYCRKQISVEFSAVTQTKNFTETLNFRNDDVILAPPGDIIAIARNSREIEVRWGPPQDDDPVCRREYFCVQLQFASRLTNTWYTELDEGSHGSMCNEGSHIFGQLTPGTLHDIRMRARVSSQANYGSWSENVTVQTLQEAPTGFVMQIRSSSQRIPGRPFKRTVHLSWNGLDVSSGSSASLDYVIQLEPSLGYNYTTNTTSFTIEGLDAFLDYHGAISAMNTAGQGPKKTFQIPDMTSQPQVPQVNYTTTPTSITVSIPTPDQPNGVIIRYEIRWSDYQVDVWRNVTLPWSASAPVIQHVISPLKPGTSYRIKVEVFNKHGSRMRIEKISTPPKAPYIKPNNFTVDTVLDEPDVVEIGWTPLQECYDMASGYRVHYCALNGTLVGSNNSCYEGSEETISIDKASNSAPDSSPFQVEGLKPFTWYSFCLEPFNEAGYGPMSEPVLVQTLQAAPSSPVDMKVSVVASSPSFINVTWSQPLTPNGVIVHYNISYNMNSTRTTATHARLKVFGDTDYVVKVSACTQPGTRFACSAATTQRLRTPIMAPSKPHIHNLLPSGPRKVKVRWDPPQHPNGPIQDYVIKVWPTSMFETATVSFVDADQREEEVMVACGEDTKEDREFQIEILARTVNEEDVKLEGESDTKGVTMCGAPSHVSAVMLALLIGLAFLIVSLVLAGLIYSRCFRISRKFDIYSLDMLSVRKRNKRFQHLRIPKPVRQESEVFDAIRSRPYCDRAEAEPNEPLDDKSPSRMPIRATNNSVPRKTEYLSKDTVYCPVIPNNVVSSRPNPCDVDDENDEDEKDNGLYSSGSSGYKSFNGYYIPVSLDPKFLPTTDGSCDDVVYTTDLVTTGVPKNSHAMPKNSDVTQSLPNVTEQSFLTSHSFYHRVKGVFASWSNVRHDTVRDVTCHISDVELMDKQRRVPPRQSHEKPDELIYCTLASLQGDRFSEERAYCD